jgi:hypothetical protein
MGTVLGREIQQRQRISAAYSGRFGARQGGMATHRTGKLSGCDNHIDSNHIDEVNHACVIGRGKARTNKH